jgi:hypothetical protein
MMLTKILSRKMSSGFMLVLRMFSILESLQMTKNWDIYESKVTSSRHQITYSAAGNYCPVQEKCCVTSIQMIFH